MRSQNSDPFTPRQYYEREYGAARRVYDNLRNYEGRDAAITNLWDTYCFANRAMQVINDKTEVPCFRAQACALWSLYLVKCLDVDNYSPPDYLPF